jgi:mevalonate kinase
VKKVEVSAPGKIILTGEHSVVYNKPAVLAAIDLRLFLSIEETRGKNQVLSCEPNGLINYGVDKLKTYYNLNCPLKINVSSEIPIGCGLGSSAALSTALSGAFRKFAGYQWNLEKINDLAYEIEKKQHGNPSGADNTVSTYGGFIYYRKRKTPRFSHLKVDKELPLLVLNTGRPDESTEEMVTLVRKLFDNTPRRVKKILKRMEGVTEHFLEFLSGREKISIRKMIKENEMLLEKLGVVSPSVMRLIRKIESIGGAAKITGSGGFCQGSGMILAYHQQPDKIKDCAKKESLEAFFVKLGEEGLRDETN